MTTKYHYFESNGAKGCLYPMDNVKAAYIELWIKAGSAYEKGNNWGALHLIEHMFFQGSKKFENNRQIELFQEEHGLSSNAWTGPQDMGIWVKFPKNETNAALELLEEALFSSTIPENEIPREINVIEHEYKDKWSDPYNRFSKNQSEFLFGKGHFATRDGLGQPEYIKSLSRSELVSIRDQFIQPQNIIFSIAGDIDVKYITEKLDSIFTFHKNKSKKAVLTKKDYAFRKNKLNYLFHKEDVRSTELNLMWTTKGWRELDLDTSLELWLGSYLLNSTRGPIYNKLRQEKGLVYKAGYSRNLSEYVGKTGFWASTDSSKVIITYKELKRIRDNFINNKIQNDEFTRAKNFISTQSLMSYDGVVNIAQKIAADLFQYNVAYSPEKIVEKLQKITESNVRSTINEMTKGEPYVFIMSSEALPEWEAEIEEAKVY